jgi:dihydropteroate synthase
MSTNVLRDLGHRTLIMGVLNVTPDSFSDGGRFLHTDAAVEHARRLIAEGADIIDIGGESTRPGAEPVPLEEELRRVIPVVQAVRREFPDACISVDTYKARVAEEALAAGANMINDVSALRFDPDMVRVVVQANVPVVLMHMKGMPKTMQQNPFYHDVIGEITEFLAERIAWACERGLDERNIIIDPGIGFGKRPEDNWEILQRLEAFKALGRPVLVGPSRKSFLGLLTGRPPAERLEETIAAAVICALHGADLVRVHDVGAVKYALAVADAVRFPRSTVR